MKRVKETDNPDSESLQSISREPSAAVLDHPLTILENSMSEVVEMQDPKLQKLVGTRLRALRKQRHWTQKELAAKVDVSFSVLNKYEGGWTSPSLDKLVELAKIFETSVDYLLTGQEPDNRPLQNRQLLERFRVLERTKHTQEIVPLTIIQQNRVYLHDHFLVDLL